MTRQLSLVLVLSVGLIVIVAALWIAAPALGSDLNPAAAAPGRVALTPPPEPLAVDKLEVAEIIELPLLAGPGASSAHLSPDGERLAYFRWKTLCILEIDAMAGYVQAALDAGVDLDNYLAAPNAFEGIDCISLEGIFNGPIEQEGVWWSPDGRYLVMSPDFFRMFYEPDIWVFDTTTLTLANITDDGEDEFNLSVPASEAAPVDILPRWMDDGRIVFLRYAGEGEEFMPYVYTVQPDGSELQQIGQLDVGPGFMVSAFDVSAQGTLVYNYWARGEDELLAGVWVSDLDGGNARQVWHNPDNPRQVPLALAWSADGQYVASYLEPDMSAIFEPAASRWRAIRIDDGQEVFFSSDYFVAAVGWAPEGSGFVYTTGDRLNQEIEGLYVASEPGAPGRMLVPAHQEEYDYPTGLMGTTPRLSQPAPWTVNNNTIMVGRGAVPGVLIVRLAAP